MYTTEVNNPYASAIQISQDQITSTYLQAIAPFNMIFNSQRQYPVFNDTTSINSDDRTTFSPSSVDFEKSVDDHEEDKSLEFKEGSPPVKEEHEDDEMFNTSLDTGDKNPSKSSISDKSRNFSIEFLIKK